MRAPGLGRQPFELEVECFDGRIGRGLSEEDVHGQVIEHGQQNLVLCLGIGHPVRSQYRTEQQPAWDRVSGAFPLTERVSGKHRYLSLKVLHLTEGESVLDVGCGDGAEFAQTRGAVGESGRILGVDLSPKLIRRARQRIEWSNVDTQLLDATQDSLGHEEFDAALAVTALSAMPGVDSTVDNIYKALKPGGRLFVADINPGGLGRFVYTKLAGAPCVDVAQDSGVLDHVPAALDSH